VSFKHRSYQKELLDGKNISFEDIRLNMQELDFINKHLGGHKVTINGIKAFAEKPAIHVVEIGCGGGDNLRIIKSWCYKRNIDLQLTGIDINKECISFATERSANKGINFICRDYSLVQFEQQPDIIFSSLFCHHFNDNELIEMMQWIYKHCKYGFFINDLHRHSLAYYSIKFLTKAFSKSYMVKNDAPLSVKRGLKKNEWKRIFAEAGIKNYQIKWKWAFRWLVICYK
jgi:2-polyprenyl-3-methyl-5-hydroxy-6-metoxy-1,4-benzoquinol methylase